MSESEPLEDDDLPTLDPPGTIAVIGAGPLGIEAALYGRFLGYDVSLIEAVEIGHSLTELVDQSLPVFPDHSLSPLASSALDAQDQESSGRTLPLTITEWIEKALVPLTETDLLRGRLLVPRRVTRIVTVPIEPDDDDEDVSLIPPDFRLTLIDPDGQTQQLDVEAIIVAVGTSMTLEIEFPLPAPYFFRIGSQSSDDWENNLLAGQHEIVAAYAQLAGHADLDLYRPKRV